MGFYLNPPERTIQVGRQLFGRSFAEFTAQMRPSECLVALGDRIVSGSLACAAVTVSS